MRTTSRHSGFSLVICLIILTLLSILVVSLISTATVDRVTSRAFANKTQAELAADTAVQQAISQLAEAITLYPDSATVWEPLPASDGSEATEGTVFYYYDKPPKTLSTDPNEVAPERFVLPLVSRDLDADGLPDGAVPMASKGDAMGNQAWDDTNSVNLNRARSNDDRVGWIGTPPPLPGAAEPTTPKPFRAKWIEVKEQANTGTGTGLPRVISRYAFWVEDESFKVNLNLLGATERKTEADSPGALISEVPIQGLLRSALAPPEAVTTISEQARNLRDGLFGKRMLDLGNFNQPSLQWEANGKTKYLGDGTKFLATIFSGGLNLSRQGSQRLNLNGLGFEKAFTTNSPTDVEIAKGLGQVVETIRFHAPKFGQRFYRLTPPPTHPTSPSAAWCNAESVSAAHQNIYLYKVAANIRDYIDPDSQPTLLIKPNPPGQKPLVATRGKPSGPMWADDSENKYWAQGKEQSPYIQEAVVRYRTSVASDKTYTLRTDYYIEVWNMSDKDLLAKDMFNPFLEITKPPGWFGHRSNPAGSTSQLRATNTPSGDPEEDRTLIIDLVNGVVHNGQVSPNGVVFKAGTFTVITTDPDRLPERDPATNPNPPIPTAPTSGGSNPANTYYCSILTFGKRLFSGTLPAQSDGLWMVWSDAVNSAGKGLSDYYCGAMLGNDFGYLDCAPYALSHNNGSTGPSVTYAKSSDGAVSRDDTFGGSLLGNSITPSQLGDPRTNNEQLVMQRYKTGSVVNEPDPTRFANPPSGSGEFYRFSLGWPNARFVYPYRESSVAPTSYRWRDYYKVWTKIDNGSSSGAPSPNANTAPAFVANENLKAIGQLGDVFDPARIKSPVGTLGIEGARGGGRTFKIGQPDDLVDMRTASALSQQWASWRLMDFFATGGDLELGGVININGLRRDNGAALRAACYGLTLHPVSQAENATTAISTPKKDFNSEQTDDATQAGLQKLITQAIQRLRETNATKPSYFRERGELSELAYFNGAENSIVSGVNASDTFDHSREELFRRLSTFITTRGNIFSVYAVGQSIQEVPGSANTAPTQRVTSTHQVKVTFALVPKGPVQQDGTSSGFQVKTESFSPDNPAAVAARFAKPDHYDVLFLQTAPL